MIWSVAWLKGMGERALKTFCQSLVGVIGVVTITHLNIPWTADLEFAGLTTLASVLTSIGNADFTAGVPKATKTVAPVKPVTVIAPTVAKPPVAPTVAVPPVSSVTSTTTPDTVTVLPPVPPVTS